jgi:hypothetical protein
VTSKPGQYRLLVAVAVTAALVAALAFGPRTTTARATPSLPKHVTLEAGDTLGMTDGAHLPTDHPLSETDHLVTQLTAKGVDWRYSAENLPGDGTTCHTSDPGTPYSASACRNGGVRPFLRAAASAHDPGDLLTVPLH